MNKSRCKQIDIIKAILCILVVLGHAITQDIRQNVIANDLFNFIYTFHMPVFFILSGIIYSNYEIKYNFKDIIRKKTPRLILPYITMSLLAYLIVNTAIVARNFIINETYLIKGIYNLSDMFKGIVFSNTNIDKHLWFIYVLFIIIIANSIIRKYIEKEKIELLVISLILAVLSYRYIYTEYMLLARILYYNFYFQLGAIIFKNYFNSKTKVIPFKSTSVLFNIIIFIICNFILLIIRKKGVYLAINPILSMGSSISAFYLLYYISNIIKSQLIIKILDVISKYNYEIYLIHNPFITIGIITVLLKLEFINIVFVILIGVITSISISILIAKFIINKSKVLRYIICGKNK
ncbi:acyltransferase family protein [Clostridium tertium]|uniref:Glucans biosynthesis protein n=1 Tax=Clostridium tertium TaxID=1559 RepID=A0A6N2ZJ99_9CLOT